MPIEGGVGTTPLQSSFSLHCIVRIPSSTTLTDQYIKDDELRLLECSSEESSACRSIPVAVGTSSRKMTEETNRSKKSHLPIPNNLQSRRKRKLHISVMVTVPPGE
eukprot:scaffold33074_cov126-Skeletonema_dohrnii-CCMP3373.AAC.4